MAKRGRWIVFWQGASLEKRSLQKKENHLKAFGKAGGFWTVEEGAGQRQARPTTRRPSPCPRYVCRGLIKTPASGAPSARRASGIPPLYGCLRPRLEGSVWALRGRQKMLPRARWVLLVSFNHFRTTTVKLPRQAKSGHACRAGPPKHALLASYARCCARSTAQNCAQELF
jgi:hypothetical protein